MHVNALTGLNTARNPVKTVQPHDMVDAKHGGAKHVMPDIISDITVALHPDIFRVERRKAPILPGSKDRVRRRSGADIFYEDITVTPYVITIGVHTERQIEIQAYAFPPGIFHNFPYLAVRLPLRIQVVVLYGFNTVIVL